MDSIIEITNFVDLIYIKPGNVLNYNIRNTFSNIHWSKRVMNDVIKGASSLIR